MTRPTDAPQPMTAQEALEQAAKICDERFKVIENDTSGDREYFYLDELENAAKAIRALAASLPSERSAIPEGWVLVPMKPTPVMVKAGKRWMTWQRGYDVEAAYDDMLAAVPSSDGDEEKQR